MTIAWLPAPLPFDAYKHHTVGTVMAMLAVCLAIAGLRQNPKWHARSLLALGLGVLCFLAYLLIVPL